MVRTNSRVRGLVIILILFRNLDHGTRRETPSVLDARLNHGSIVVDAFSADGAGRERHVQVVKVREREQELSGEDGGGSSGTCLRYQRKLGEGGEDLWVRQSKLL